jgi:hypothetical protein
MSKVEVKINNDIWCELEVEDRACKYKFLLSNIPIVVGGYKHTGDAYWDSYWEQNRTNYPPKTINGIVMCKSQDDASQCAVAIKELLLNGYDEKACWLIGMDVQDLVTSIFDGTTVNYFHKSFESSFDIESSQKGIERVKDSSVMLLSYTMLPVDNLSDTEKVTGAISANNEDADILCQSFVRDSCYRAIDIWYR